MKKSFFEFYEEIQDAKQKDAEQADGNSNVDDEKMKEMVKGRLKKFMGELGKYNLDNKDIVALLTVALDELNKEDGEEGNSAGDGDSGDDSGDQGGGMGDMGGQGGENQQ